MARSVLIEFRRGTAAAWTAANPVLAAGEPGWESDTDKLKIGDGVTAWNALSYFSTGGVGTITSTGGSLTVTNPSGPTANLDLPNSGAAAGTYGDATHASRVTVNALGIVTAISSVAIAGGSANISVLFDSLLGADAASIDTGANGIAQTAKHLLCLLTARTTQAAVLSAANITLNGDGAANYDRYSYTISGATAAIGSGFGITAFPASCLGDTADANAYTSIILYVPDYTSAHVHAVWYANVEIGTAAPANSVVQVAAWRYRTAAAVTQMTAAAGSGNMKAGSRLTIYGLG